ncbi:hypothetical protein PUS82_00350 [Cytobacillus firmus]|uniref:hypothetical protein n=1 Tax=Cytobacillus firmus TaxID=1399 RepID=UPI00237AA795|nr:hypothetical protein [Cytobacillus firmus]MDD9309781.1 hypothetical protein [Cytobacillus firmus]
MDKVTHWIWQIGVDYLLYLLLFGIVFWTVKEFMYSTLKESVMMWNYKRRIRQHKVKRTLEERIPFNNALLKHIDILLKTTSKKKEAEVSAFLITSVILGIFTLIFILMVLGDLFVAIVFGLLISLIPYILLRLKLNKIRHHLDLEFLHIVQRLTQNYNAMQNDMYFALSETQKEIQSPLLKKVIIRLISDLQVSRNEAELKESVKVFTYTAGTNWAKRLGSIILKAYLHNEKVLNALIVLTKQMEDTEEMLEEEKSQTMDTVINGYITLPVFVASLVLGFYTSGAQDWWKLQFGSKWPMLFFLFCVIGVVFSIITSVFLKRPRNDL